MITGISIENFKGIRGIEDSEGNLQPVEIELRPLTLLFGANSAGKSSILHALQYAAEVFERRNLDAGLIGDGAAGYWREWPLDRIVRMEFLTLIR
jgi:predicted ATPase